MHDILMGFSLTYWNPNAVIEGIEEVSKAGFPGFEGTPDLVNRYEDRIEVFSEILERTDMELISICNRSNFLIEDRMEEEIEIDMNIARFLHNVGAQFLVVTGGPRRPEGNTEDDWRNLLVALDELGQRSIKSSIRMCLMPCTGTIVESRADIDRVMEGTKEDFVHLCPDTGELRARNIDPLELTRTYSHRIPYVRFRDVLDRRFMSRPRLVAKARAEKLELAQPVGVEFGKGLCELQPYWDLLNELEFGGWAMAVIEEPRGKSQQVMSSTRLYLEQNMEMIF